MQLECRIYYFCVQENERVILSDGADPSRFRMYWRIDIDIVDGAVTFFTSKNKTA